MNGRLRCLLIAGGLLLLAVPGFAAEPKHGGIWHIYHRDSPASASIHEEATYSTVIPFMPVMNNLIMYKQDAAQNIANRSASALPERGCRLWAR